MPFSNVSVTRKAQDITHKDERVWLHGTITGMHGDRVDLDDGSGPTSISLVSISEGAEKGEIIERKAPVKGTIKKGVFARIACDVDSSGDGLELAAVFVHVLDDMGCDVARFKKLLELESRITRD